MARPRLILAAFALIAAACGDDEGSTPPVDSGTPMDGSMMADAEAGPPPEDAALQDTGTPLEDAAMDAGHDSAVEVDSGHDAGTDASTPGITQAVLGVRCALSERIGLIEVRDEGGTVYLGGTMYDRPNAAIGEPEISDEVCDFHRAAPQTGDCATCDYAVEVCNPSTNACAPAQQPIDDTVIEVIGSASSQTFEHNEGDSPGFVYGQVTAGAPFGLEVRWGEQTVVLDTHEMPAGVADLAGTLMGTYETPEGASFTWNGLATGVVFTRVPINHHVGGPTFTECTVDASAGALHIDGEMLTPLAVSTGLEFQGLEHMFVAAAETSAGCVELRYTIGQYISL